MHHSRTYSYDDQRGDHAGGVYTENGQYSQQYLRGYHQPQGSGQFYVQATGNADETQPDPYVRSMTPMMQSHHYSSGGNHRYYQGPTGGSSSQTNSSSTYPTQSSYYPSQYARSQTPGMHASEGGQFIPTPSELYAYSPRQPPQSPAQDPYSTSPYAPPHVYVPSLRSPEQRSRVATGRPAVSPGSPIASPSGERFPCEKCGKTFSRSHDRKRHHETQHLTSPVIHRCRFCEKEFSRADSLKRHLDNGCDEMPS